MKVVDIKPMPVKCPHCKKHIETLHRIHKGIIEQTAIFVCPECQTIISIGMNLGW